MSEFFTNRRVTHRHPIGAKVSCRKNEQAQEFISLDTETGFRVKLHKVVMHVK